MSWETNFNEAASSLFTANEMEVAFKGLLCAVVFLWWAFQTTVAYKDFGEGNVSGGVLAWIAGRGALVSTVALYFAVG